MMSKLAELVLASRSPRRRELLAQAGYEFRVCPPADETEPDIEAGERPTDYVVRMARAKAADVAGRVDSGVVLGCDTVAECAGKILGKPADAADARRMLTSLSGQVHRVHSGLCLWPPEGPPMAGVATTVLKMLPLAPEQIDEYLATGLWQGKAGAFGYQDRLGWLEIVEGSESNVVGLPLELLRELLARLAD